MVGRNLDEIPFGCAGAIKMLMDELMTQPRVKTTASTPRGPAESVDQRTGEVVEKVGGYARTPDPIDELDIPF